MLLSVFPVPKTCVSHILGLNSPLCRRMYGSHNRFLRGPSSLPLAAFFLMILLAGFMVWVTLLVGANNTRKFDNSRYDNVRVAFADCVRFTDASQVVVFVTLAGFSGKPANHFRSLAIGDKTHTVRVMLMSRTGKSLSLFTAMCAIATFRQVLQ